jgi:hypothetical protein
MLLYIRRSTSSYSPLLDEFLSALLHPYPYHPVIFLLAEEIMQAFDEVYSRQGVASPWLGMEGA